MLFDKVQFLLLSSTRPTLQKESTVDACPFLRLTVTVILPLSAGSHLITEWYKRRLLVLYTNKTTLVVCSLGTRFLNWFLMSGLADLGRKNVESVSRNLCGPARVARRGTLDQDQNLGDAHFLDKLRSQRSFA